ncbi:MAG: hypothetical protein HY363_03920 [Candidatus Aenigmarchaeota archaeon]|nr:hypothetical protein [Candidatus Aenigmarchaeota archaeon]
MEDYFITARKKGEEYFYFMEYNRTDPHYRCQASIVPSDRVRENPSAIACSKDIADEASRLLQERGYDVVIIKNGQHRSLDYLLMVEQTRNYQQMLKAQSQK